MLQVPLPFDVAFQTRAMITELDNCATTSGLVRNLLPTLARWSADLERSKEDVDGLFKTLCARLPDLIDAEHTAKACAAEAKARKEADELIWSRFRTPRSI